MQETRSRVIASALCAIALMAAPAFAGEPEPDLLWADAGGGTGFDVGFRVAALTDGGSVTFGYLTEPATFGAITLNATASGYGLFLVKHDANGTVVWAKAIDEGGDPMSIAGTSDGGFVATINGPGVVATENHSLSSVKALFE